MKIYTDGVSTIEVGSKYAHIFNRAGSWIGRIHITNGSYLERIKAAGFKEVEIQSKGNNN